MQALPRIARSDPSIGYLTEALMAAIAIDSDEAGDRLRAFREKRAPKAVPN
jgi:(methylthio)acryloyl-CoA hydratase